MSSNVKPHLFTASIASEMGKRSALAREAKRQRLMNEEIIEPENVQQEKFRLTRLKCVRAQLVSIDKAIAVEIKRKPIDAGQVDRLASAAIRLNEQERQLSNRSLPPTLKANAAPRARRGSTHIPEPEAENL